MELLMISEKDLVNFENDGYVILRNFIENKWLQDVKTDIEELGKIVLGQNFSFENFLEIECSEIQQSLIYDRLKYCPSLHRISSNERIMSLCKSIGLNTPHLMGCCNMRMDKPNGKHLFDWHQDSLYLLGSLNAITIWFPISNKVDSYHGTIEVIPGSHKKGILPFKKISDKPIEEYIPFYQRDLNLDMEVLDKPVLIEAEFGDCVIFKQMLLHRSTQNFSNEIRWTGQLRITDLSCEIYRREKFPTGDKTNIFFVNYDL